MSNIPDIHNRLLYKIRYILYIRKSARVFNEIGGIFLCFQVVRDAVTFIVVDGSFECVLVEKLHVFIGACITKKRVIHLLIQWLAKVYYRGKFA